VEERYCNIYTESERYVVNISMMDLQVEELNEFLHALTLEKHLDKWSLYAPLKDENTFM
jgi:hypothetical protein